MAGRNDWTDDELRAIVSDYFSMLADEVAGRPYSKTAHRNNLMNSVNRSAGSIERKHQNISAVLRELGRQWIAGYKPLPNFQNALLPAVKAQLDREIEAAEDGVLENEEEPADPSAVFVPPPPPTPEKADSSKITRVLAKYDRAVRDAANRKLGEAGEDFVFGMETKRLKMAGRQDLADKVEWTSKQFGDGAGYDIASFADDGTAIFIEVKTTKGPITTPFYISNNELRVAAE